MNQEIHWGKIAALVVAIAGIASIAFVAGRKNAEVPVSEKQEVRLSDKGSSSATGEGDDQQKESSEKTVRYENKTYGFSMDIPVSWTGIEEEDARGSSTEMSFLTEDSTTRLTLAIIPPETFNETIRLCSLWIKYQYGADGASKNELADAQLCQSLGYKGLADSFIARNKGYYFSLGRWSAPENLDDTAQAAVDSFKILDNWIQWKKYRNEKYGFEFQYPDSFSLPNEALSTVVIGDGDDIQVAIDNGDTYDSINIQFATRDALFRGSYSPFSIDVYSPEAFRKRIQNCQSKVAEPLACARFPFTDEEDQEYAVQKNNKYYMYMDGTLWQDSSPVDWMTPAELGWVSGTFKVFDVK